MQSIHFLLYQKLSPFLYLLFKLLDILLQFINNFLECPPLRTTEVGVFPMHPAFRHLVIGIFLLQLILQVAVGRVGESAERLLAL